MDEHNKTYPEGYFLALGLALGIPFGLVFAVTLENFGFIGMGLPFGLAMGLALEAKYKKEGKIRPAGPKDLRRKTIGLVTGIVVALIFLVIFLVMVFR